MLLFVSQWYPSDSNEYYTPFIKEHLLSLAEGADVFAITGNLTENRGIRREESKKITNIRIPLNPKRHFILNMIKFNFLAMWQILKIKNMKFDIVVFNVFTSIFTAFLTKFLINSKIVFIEHWSFWVRKKVSWLSIFLLIFDKVYVVSENVRDSFLGKVKNKTEIIENVVDGEVFNFQSSIGNNFIFVGRLEKIKRVDRIIEAFSVANIAGSKLKIIGNGSEINRLKKLASDLKVDDKVVFLGALNKQEIAGNLREAKALLLFSETENKPCVICEAHYVGLPVLSNSVGGIVDMIDKTNGLLVDENSIESYANRSIYPDATFERAKIRSKAIGKYSRLSFRKQLINDTD